MAKTKVVLVEDDEILGKVIQEELKEADFDVTHATDGEAGVKAIKARKPDLVLCDVIMPKKDGFAVLEEIKSFPATKDIPIIMLTMLGSDEDIKKGLKMGAVDYIVKSQHAVAEIVEKVENFFNSESHPNRTYEGSKQTPKKSIAQEASEGKNLKVTQK
jgi:two-component system, sensor histidine kinase and response regulator